MNWFEELKEKYSSGVAVGFILHLNTADYVGESSHRLAVYLGSVMSKIRKVICYYNRADGITFPVETMRMAFDAVTGFREDPLTPGLPKSPGQALPLLEKLLATTEAAQATEVAEGKPGGAMVVIEDAESLIPDADMAMMIPEDRTSLVTVRRWASHPALIARGNIVILVTSNLSDLHRSIRAATSRYETIRIPYPDSATRVKFVVKLDNAKKLDGTPAYTFQRGIDSATVVRATAGLSLVHIEDIYLRAQRDGLLDWKLVSERKRDVMRSEFADVLEMMEPRYGFEAIGGLENVKKFFQKNMIDPIKDGRFGRVPMGVLMTGPAGTGKTIMAEAVAKESGINMAVLNPAKIFSKWVGESERNLEKALEAVKSLAPTLVFIDEIDQQLRRGESGDSGVSNRVFKRLMEFMSDTGNRGRVVFLAATNRPDLLDAALKRPGRFDAKIPFLAPNQLDRAHIFDVMCRKYEVDTAGFPGIASEWAARTDGWTGAEIERLTIKSRSIIEDDHKDALQAMRTAMEYIRARTQDIDRMTQIAIDECDDLEFVPVEYRGKGSVK